MAYKVGRCLLQDHLDKIGMTQIQLAHKLKVKPQQINKYVRGKQKMSLETAKNISVIVKCRMEELYDWVDCSRP